MSESAEGGLRKKRSRKEGKQGDKTQWRKEGEGVGWGGGDGCGGGGGVVGCGGDERGKGK